MFSMFSSKSSAGGGGSSSAAASGETDHFSRVCTRDDFSGLLQRWQEKCEAKNEKLPKATEKELKKRISSDKSNTGTKAKLNFSANKLNDVHIKALMETLALKPIISKLDLSKNSISEQSAKVILKLVMAQVKLLQSTDVDMRRDACFIGELILTGSSEVISEETLNNIQSNVDILKFANAQAHIRKLYLDNGAPDSINSVFLTRMWKDVIGKEDKEAIVKALAGGKEHNGNNLLTYLEMESALREALSSDPKKGMPTLTVAQKETVAALLVEAAVGIEEPSPPPPPEVPEAAEQAQEEEIAAPPSSDKKKEVVFSTPSEDNNNSPKSQSSPSNSESSLARRLAYASQGESISRRASSPNFRPNSPSRSRSVVGLTINTNSSGGEPSPPPERALSPSPFDKEASRKFRADNMVARRKSIAALPPVSGGPSPPVSPVIVVIEEGTATEEKEEEEQESPLVNPLLLDFTDGGMTTFEMSLSLLQPPSMTFATILVLVLRNNQLSDIAAMKLDLLTHLTDLDLACNKISGKLVSGSIPSTVLRLDLSYNQITEITGIIGNTQLKVLNVSNNEIKKLDGTPPDLDALDISFNHLSSAFSLRMLSFSPKLTSLNVEGNPIIQLAPKKEAEVKSIVVSVLPKLCKLDGVPLAKKYEATKKNKEAPRSASPTTSERNTRWDKKNAAAGGGANNNNKSEINTSLVVDKVQAAAAAKAGAKAQSLLISRKAQREKDGKRSSKDILEERQKELAMQREQVFSKMEEQSRRIKKMSRQEVQSVVDRLTKTTTEAAAARRAAAAGNNSLNGVVDGSTYLNTAESIQEGIKKVREWSMSVTQDLGRAAATFTIMLQMTQDHSLDHTALNKFSFTLSGVAHHFPRDIKLPEAIEKLIRILPSGSEPNDLIDEVQDALEKMSIMAAVLYEAERIVETVASIEQLRKRVDQLMTSEDGMNAKLRILMPLNIDFSYRKPTFGASTAISANSSSLALASDAELIDEAIISSSSSTIAPFDPTSSSSSNNISSSSSSSNNKFVPLEEKELQSIDSVASMASEAAASPVRTRERPANANANANVNIPPTAPDPAAVFVTTAAVVPPSSTVFTSTTNSKLLPDEEVRLKMEALNQRLTQRATNGGRPPEPSEYRTGMLASAAAGGGDDNSSVSSFGLGDQAGDEEQLHNDAAAGSSSSSKSLFSNTNTPSPSASSPPPSPPPTTAPPAALAPVNEDNILAAIEAKQALKLSNQQQQAHQPAQVTTTVPSTVAATTVAASGLSIAEGTSSSAEAQPTTPRVPPPNPFTTSAKLLATTAPQEQEALVAPVVAPSPAVVPASAPASSTASASASASAPAPTPQVAAVSAAPSTSEAAPLDEDAAAAATALEAKAAAEARKAEKKREIQERLAKSRKEKQKATEGEGGKSEE